MKIRSLTLGLLLSLFTAFFATNAFAVPSSGLDIRVSGTAPIIGFSTEIEANDGFGATYEENRHSKDWMVGFNARLSVGYRFSMLGIYIDQDLAWVKYNNKEKKEVDPYFLGGTYLTFRLLVPISSLEFDFGLGLGMMYDNGDDWRAGTKHPALITDKDGDASPCFAIKLGLEFTYFFTDFIGIGIDLDYAIGMIFVDYQYHGDYKYEQTDYVHHFTPGLHVRLAF